MVDDFGTKSKHIVGNSWPVLKAILGYKYHRNHSMKSISTDHSQNPQQKVVVVVVVCFSYIFVFDCFVSAHVAL